MTMLKGYVMPSPNANDGEYGGFGGVQFAAYAASPAEHPYWEGQGIARSIPALNGFGTRLTGPDFVRGRRGQREYVSTHSRSEGTHGFGDALPSTLPPIPLIVGAIVGRVVLGNLRGALIGAGLGYAFRDKFAALAGFGNACVTNPDGTMDCGTPYGPAPGMLPEGLTILPSGGYTTPAGGETSPDHSLGQQQPSNTPFVVAALVGLKFLLF